LAKKGWRELQTGGLIVPGGNAVEYETGNWRTELPVIDLERCNHCMICWIYCPEGTILVTDGKVTGVNQVHCKGCGICATECPTKVIDMIREMES
jgi:2-oxoacid:acceptor oxidoreductase delta subunit (pyruvate/2-ketoisovalerate family)